MKNKLKIVSCITLLGSFSILNSYTNPGTEQSEQKQEITVDEFIERNYSYEHYNSLPELVDPVFENWSPVFSNLHEREIKITNKTSPLKWIFIFGFDKARKIQEHDNKVLEKLSELDYKRKDYCFNPDTGMYTINLERTRQELELQQHRFIRFELNLEEYLNEKNLLGPYLENPSLENDANPFEKINDLGELIYRISFSDK